MDYPRTVEEIAADYNQRRAGILKALTEEVDDFYPLCDPSKVRICNGRIEMSSASHESVISHHSFLVTCNVRRIICACMVS